MRDDSQIKAIYFPVNSSVFVTAPPGHGKTYVMMKRIEYLISRNIIKLPSKILALTFSNSAADEMKKRIKSNIPQCEKYVDIMTYHTFAYMLLRKYGNYVDINRAFTIINEKNKFEYINNYYNTILFNTSSDHWGQEYKFRSEYNDWYNTKYLQGKYS